MNECFTDAIFLHESRKEKSVDKEVSDEEEERDGVESKLCDSVTCKVQFNVNCQMIS